MRVRAALAILGCILVAGLAMVVRGPADETPPEPERGDVPVRVVAAEAVQASPIRVGFGRVVDPLPLVDAVGGWSVARRALAYAEIERRRVEGLAAHDRNASVREVEAARLAESRAAIDLQSALARVVAVWGADAAARPDLESIAGRLAAGRAAIARFDLPVGAPAAELADLRLAPAEAGAPDLATMPLGAAPAADPLTRGRAYLLVIERDAPPAGSPLAARVESQPVAGVAVPDSAIVWFDGGPSVFVATDHGFERRTIVRVAALPGGGWLVEHGVDPGEPIVVAGAQQLLSSQILSVTAVH
ncbi:MAG TPA: hypothetical protein VNE71_06215 [Myxococcota bacterium]|nr:hypothetical protein [Myxococcota bacterium]